MKRSTTYYFLLLLCLSGFFAHCIDSGALEMRRGVRIILEGKPLPLCTQLAIDYHWWPWVFVPLCILGAIGSLTWKTNDRVFIHALLCLLLVELSTMFIMVMSLFMPWLLLHGYFGSP